MHRAHLGSVCRCEGLKDPPRNTDKRVTNEQLDGCLGEEEDEYEGATTDKSPNQSLLVAKPIRDNAIEEQAKDLTTEITVRKAGLLCRRKLIGSIRLLYAELTLKGRLCVEIVKQDSSKAFHHNTRG